MRELRTLSSVRSAKSLGLIALWCVGAACNDPQEVVSSPVRVAIVDTGVSRIGVLAPILDARERLSVVADEGPDDHDGHGTKLATLVHLQSPRAKLVSVKAIGLGGRLTDEYLAAAVRRAVELNARVVLLAVSGAAPLPLTRLAISDAGRADVLVVVAAGNSGVDLDVYPAYPAGYLEPNMVVVAATNGAGRLLASSNRTSAGPAFALASGLALQTCSRDGEPATIGGTSAASALVAGRAAELLATKRLSMRELRMELLAGGDETGVRVERLDCQ